MRDITHAKANHNNKQPRSTPKLVELPRPKDNHYFADKLGRQ